MNTDHEYSSEEIQYLYGRDCYINIDVDYSNREIFEEESSSGRRTGRATMHNRLLEVSKKEIVIVGSHF